MKFWEPQVSLFQPVPIRDMGNGTYSLATPEDATVKETRFLCHFHDSQGRSDTSFSQFSFNYEYVLWRKNKLPMYKKEGPDVSTFELSQLLFSCPIPDSMKEAAANSKVYLDLVPIRTPPRRDKPLFTVDHVGPEEFGRMQDKNEIFDAEHEFGNQHILPAIRDSGRLANLPLCPSPKKQVGKKPHHLVACTWTSASYRRRGDAVVIDDSAARLKEWIIFHRLVGVDHLYVYDNTQMVDSTHTESPLRKITADFGDFVTYIPWPHSVCSNNRPNHKNPGERSSQYAADAACRTQFGPLTEWMSFLDTDEYIAPMNRDSWTWLLREMEQEKVDVLKMRSSRGRPRVDYTEVMKDQSVCPNPNGRKSRLQEEPCVGPRRNETFLRVYNCDYIRHPRPERFSRAMKQIYRPARVLSHFVHYSTVTKDIARYYSENHDKPSLYQRSVSEIDYHDRFLDELTEGVLIHTKSVLPHETSTRTATCHNASKHTCIMGHECPESTVFDDATHQKNLFHDENGRFCNCWVEPYVENYWIPKLEKALADHP